MTMIERKVRYICGCEEVATHPSDSDLLECIQHGELEVAYVDVLKKEVSRLREEVCRLDIASALISPDPAMRSVAEQLMRNGI